MTIQSEREILMESQRAEELISRYGAVPEATAGPGLSPFCLARAMRAAPGSQNEQVAFAKRISPLLERANPITARMLAEQEQRENEIESWEQRIRMTVLERTRRNAIRSETPSKQSPSMWSRLFG
jgi:hypothetical protein